MKNVFSDLVSITRGLHRDNRGEKDYKILINNQKIVDSSPFSRFKLDFKKPLNAKKRFYLNLINNQLENEITSFNKNFSKNLTEPENAFKYKTYFNKYDKYLKDINNYITKHNISNNYLNDDSYIIHYLKVSALRLYVELQEGFGNYSDEPYFDIKELAEKYFFDTEFDKLLILKIVEDKPKPENKKKRKLKKVINYSFGFKNRDTAKLKQVITQLQLKVDLLQINTSGEELVSLLLAEDYRHQKAKIYIQCETTQFSYIVSCLKPFFNNLNPTSIERSEKFISKTGTPIKASNLYKNKVFNTKQKEDIDKIIEYLK